MSFFSDIWSTVPECIRLRINILRRVSIWRLERVIFIHVPKAAGVSVSNSVYGKPLGHFYASMINQMFPKLFENCFTFGVVRHPVARLYSAYRFAISGGTSEMSIANADIYKTTDFKTFDSFVNNWLIYKDVRTLDGVFRPQYLYLCENDEIIVDRWYKLENIDMMVDEISSYLNRSVYLKHQNKSVSTTPLMVSSKTLGIIYQIYKKDFQIFGYELERYT